jgi:RimJ/RimL family protein N-acetyltransferase
MGARKWKWPICWTRRFGGWLATEAAQAIAHYALRGVGILTLNLPDDRENAASIRVATKIGMTFEKKPG